MNRSDERFPNFDILRLLLALEVVVDHAWSVYHATPLWRGAIPAVPAFLAISGCLVLKSISTSPSWGAYALKRFLRVMPALLLSFLICLFLFNRWVMYNSVLHWLVGGLDPALGEKNMPLWSLAWEELAYLCLAILWVLGAYQRKVIVWALLIAAIFLGFYGNRFASEIRIIFWLAPAFLVGNLAYLYRSQLQKVHPSIPWIFLVLVLSAPYIPAIGFVVYKCAILFQTFAVVWVGLAGAPLIKRKFPDISYGAYIYHYPIIMYLHEVVGISTPKTLALVLPAPLLAICLFSWYIVEKPALRMKPKAPVMTTPPVIPT